MLIYKCITQILQNSVLIVSSGLTTVFGLFCFRCKLPLYGIIFNDFVSFEICWDLRYSYTRSLYLWSI